MKFLQTLVSLALVGDVALASSWFSKAAYNKWHETELERWLSDHDVPYPTPSDRKDLQKLVEKNWNGYVVSPYQSWDTDKLNAYLTKKGVQTKDDAKATKESLVSQVQGQWYETEDKAQNAYGSVKDWILDSWSESTLKAFADHHNIPVPQPRKRDTLLTKVRSSYDSIAQKAGQTTAYPGNWLYDSWSESDLKEWLDTHGIPAPQPTSRDKLISTVRRNSRLAYLQYEDTLASASSSAANAYATVTDKLVDSWSESDLKAFADKNGIPVPQGTKVNALRALIRKNRAALSGNNLSASAASAYGAATSGAGNQYAKATDSASLAAQDAFGQAVDTWSDSRLKAYLDARGVPVPHASKKDELRALVRKNGHKAASGYSAWTFDDFSIDNLKSYISANGDAAAQKLAAKSGATREELSRVASSQYSSASKAGGTGYASVTSYLAAATDAAKQSTFETWTESDLKAYLDGYGIPVPQGTNLEELKALVRRQSTYFRYGTSSPSGTILAKLGESVKASYDWVLTQLGAGADVAKQQAADARKKVKDEL